MQWSDGITETPPDGTVAQELVHGVVNDRPEYLKCTQQLSNNKLLVWKTCTVYNVNTLAREDVC